MGKLTTSLVGFFLMAGSSAALRANSIFDFNADAFGTGTSFTDTNSGLSATFTAPDPANANSPISAGFIVQNQNPFVNMSGNNLYENAGDVNGAPGFGTVNYSNLNLQIQFSSSVNSVTFPFALNAPAGSTLTLTAYNGGTLVGSIVSGPSQFATGYSYGSLAFNPGVSFDSIVLGNAFQFAIDDLATVDEPVPGVPEPASTALVMFGFAGMLAYIRRYLRRRAAAL